LVRSKGTKPVENRPALLAERYVHS
jgi:hypothetical protein